MSRKSLYMVLAVATAVVLGWLHWFVVPDLAVVTVAPGQPLAPGWALGKIGEKSQKIEDVVMIADFARGWAGLAAWWPFATAAALIGAAVGWYLGRWLQDDDHAEAAQADKVYAEQRLALAEQARAEAEQFRQQAYKQNKETVAIKEASERAEATALSAIAAQAEAERKLLAEREKHKAELSKAGAAITKLRKKTEKQGLDSE